MAFTILEFDKTWLDREAFPTHETREDQVRADMQYLFDFIKDFINSLLTSELNSENVPFTPSGAISESNVQDAIEYVFSQIQQAAVSELADGSVTSAKLNQTSGQEAVVTAAIRDEAVTGAKIAPGAITSTHLGTGAISGNIITPGSIPLEAMGTNSVSTAQIVNNKVTYDKLANDSVYGHRIKNGGIIAGKFAAGAVQENDIYDGSIKSRHIAQGEVKTTNIFDGAVTEAKIYTGAVTANKIGSLAVTTGKIYPGAVTPEKTTGIQAQHTVVGPITIATSAWDTTTIEATVDVTGVSAENVATQSVYFTPAADTDWERVVNDGIRALRIPPEDGKVTFKARVVPAENVSVYFDIYD